MKTIGIIGGMSFESTLEYYKIINQEIAKRLGGLHSAKMLFESYDFDEIEALQSKEDWQTLGQILINSAKKLENAGADYIAIATNTMHLVADEVQNNINIPLIHIAQAAANAVKAENIDTVALFGTVYTMTKPFYKDKLKNEFGINVIVPDNEKQQVINDIIYNELCKGIIKETSKNKLETIIQECAKKGARAVILGCTELPNIIKYSDIDGIKIINTTHAHCMEIANRIV